MPYINTIDMSIFIMDYDYNAENTEYLRKTHEPFFKRIRENFLKGFHFSSPLKLNIIIAEERSSSKKHTNFLPFRTIISRIFENTTFF